MSRQDQYNVTVSIDGEDKGTWDKMEGGEVDSEERKYRPGNMATEVSLGGSVSVGNVTVTRLYELARDHLNVKAMMARAGKGTVVVKKQPLDVDGNPFGSPLVYQGTLKAVTPPEVDSESNDPGLLAIEVSSAGLVG